MPTTARTRVFALADLRWLIHTHTVQGSHGSLDTTVERRSVRSPGVRYGGEGDYSVY